MDKFTEEMWKNLLQKNTLVKDESYGSVYRIYNSAKTLKFSNKNPDDDEQSQNSISERNSETNSQHSQQSSDSGFEINATETVEQMPSLITKLHNVLTINNDEAEALPENDDFGANMKIILKQMIEDVLKIGYQMDKNNTKINKKVDNLVSAFILFFCQLFSV